jgi:subtilisin family serine protease
LHRAEKTLSQLVKQRVPCGPVYSYYARIRLIQRKSTRDEIEGLLSIAKSLHPEDTFAEKTLAALSHIEPVGTPKVVSRLAEIQKGWAFQTLGIANAWKAGFTGKGVTVGILDTRVDGTRPELKNRLLPGKSFVADEGLEDGHGHGTFDTTLLAAVAPDAKLLPIKVLNRTGTGLDGDILHGINFAIEKKVDILLHALSLPRSDVSIAYAKGLQRAQSQGMLIVGPAGQGGEGKPEPVTPSSSHMLIVGSVNNDLHRAYFSNYGQGVHLFAPGVNISSLWNDGRLRSLNGNSMAATITAGVAALVKQARPGFTASDLANALLSASREMPGPPPFRLLRVPRM